MIWQLPDGVRTNGDYCYFYYYYSIVIITTIVIISIIIIIIIIMIIMIIMNITSPLAKMLNQGERKAVVAKNCQCDILAIIYPPLK